MDYFLTRFMQIMSKPAYARTFADDWYVGFMVVMGSILFFLSCAAIWWGILCWMDWPLRSINKRKRSKR